MARFAPMAQAVLHMHAVYYDHAEPNCTQPTMHELAA